MRSSAQSCPLTSSTSASSSAFFSSFYVSFSSLLSSLFFTSSTKRATTTSTTSSFVSSPPPCLPTTSLFSLSLALLVFFQCCLVVVALPPAYHSSYPPLETRHGEFVVERTTYFTKNLTWENGSMHVQADMPQKDEPKRKFNSGNKFPQRWGEGYQKRHAYLIAKNDQYVYIKNGRITGTKIEYPKRGIVKFSSDAMHVVIQSLHDDSFVCMNATGHVYMSVQLNTQDCHIRETPLVEQGFRDYSYEFVNHRSKEKALYLGIDCDPLKGAETKIEQESSRFTVVYVRPDEAERLKQQVLNGQEESLEDGPKCIKKSAAKAAKKLQKKLRARWCRNFPRMRSDMWKYLDKCRMNYCNPKDGKGPPADCVCTMLKRMFLDKERTKRECLVEHVSRWVKKRKARPNKMYIKRFVDVLLVSQYEAIMKRIREVRRLKQNEKAKKVEKLDSSEVASPANPSSPDPPHKTHRRKKGKRGKKHKRAKKVKLSFLLKKYWPQLTASTTAGSKDYQSDSPLPSVSALAAPEGSLSVANIMPKLSPSLSSIPSSPLLSALSSSSSSSSLSSQLSESSSPSSSSLSSSSFLHHLTEVSDHNKIDTKYNDKITTTSSLPSSNSKLLRSASKSSPGISSSSSTRSSARKHRIRHPRKHRRRRRKNRKGKDNR